MTKVMSGIRETPAPAWQPIETAPKDGRDIEIMTAGGFEMRARWERLGFENAEGKSVGAWVASEEDKHPPCWTDGACWESNEDEMPSDPPDVWRPLHPIGSGSQLADANQKPESSNGQG